MSNLCKANKTKNFSKIQSPIILYVNYKLLKVRQQSPKLIFLNKDRLLTLLIFNVIQINLQNLKLNWDSLKLILMTNYLNL